jgi:hypothetical protein
MPVRRWNVIVLPSDETSAPLASAGALGERGGAVGEALVAGLEADQLVVHLRRLRLDVDRFDGLEGIGRLEVLR